MDQPQANYGAMVLPCPDVQAADGNTAQATNCFQQCIPDGLQIVAVLSEIHFGNRPHRWNVLYRFLDAAHPICLRSASEVKRKCQRMKPANANVGEVSIIHYDGEQVYKIQYIDICECPPTFNRFKRSASHDCSCSSITVPRCTDAITDTCA